jgi:hypothetical protein
MSCTESSADTTIPSAVTRRVIASDAIGRANGQRTGGSYVERHPARPIGPLSLGLESGPDEGAN